MFPPKSVDAVNVDCTTSIVLQNYERRGSGGSGGCGGGEGINFKKS